ncbi:PhzF family phenazine biosynthesis isomerase [Streptomyces collinus]|uniref:PhzF family phenazine biosynthesis isomerase n=1 Tax=Streptomyces collinus TaxID=42684 RepID=UPI0036EC567B
MCDLTDVLHYAAFTNCPDGGNPAGIVLDASQLNEEAMQRIARSVGYSETVFVTFSDTRRRIFHLRYFSPLSEVIFCGHATIAVSVAIAERVGPGKLLMETAAGKIHVRTTVNSSGGMLATLTSVPTRSRPVLPAELSAALSALRWTPAELDPSLPPHVAFAGESHLILAAASRARLAELDYDFDDLAGIMRAYGWTTAHLVWREEDDYFHARNPFPVGGVIEDPATGAAAAAFGGYLHKLGLLPDGFVTIRQGEDMGRPSDLIISGANDTRIRVTGGAVSMLAPHIRSA